jgi:hypothetical protein
MSTTEFDKLVPGCCIPSGQVALTDFQNVERTIMNCNKNIYCNRKCLYKSTSWNQYLKSLYSVHLELKIMWNLTGND